MSWRLLPVLIAAMQSLSSSSWVMEITMRRSFSALSGCGGSEAKGWSPRLTSAGRAGAMTGTTTDGTASPLRASRLAVMAANLVELTDGSPEVLRQYYVWPVVRSADRKSTRLNSSHSSISYAVFCLKKKKKKNKIKKTIQLI